MKMGLIREKTIHPKDAASHFGRKYVNEKI